jgi:hypothetical protein
VSLQSLLEKIDDEYEKKIKEQGSPDLETSDFFSQFCQDIGIGYTSSVNDSAGG